MATKAEQEKINLVYRGPKPGLIFRPIPLATIAENLFHSLTKTTSDDGVTVWEYLFDKENPGHFNAYQILKEHFPWNYFTVPNSNVDLDKYLVLAFHLPAVSVKTQPEYEQVLSELYDAAQACECTDKYQLMYDLTQRTLGHSKELLNATKGTLQQSILNLHVLQTQIEGELKKLDELLDTYTPRMSVFGLKIYRSINRLRNAFPIKATDIQTPFQSAKAMTEMTKDYIKQLKDDASTTAPDNTDGCSEC